MCSLFLTSNTKKMFLLKKIVVAYAFLFASICAFAQLSQNFSFSRGSILVGDPSLKEFTISIQATIDNKTTTLDTWSNGYFFSGFPHRSKNTFITKGNFTLPDNKTTATFSFCLKAKSSDTEKDTYTLSYDISLPEDSPKCVIKIIGLSKSRRQLCQTRTGIFSITPCLYKKGNTRILAQSKSEQKTFNANFNLTVEKYIFNNLDLSKHSQPIQLQWLPKSSNFGRIKYFFDSESPKAILLDSNKEITLPIPSKTKFLYVLGSPSSPDKSLPLAWRAKQSDGSICELFSEKISVPQNAESVVLTNKTQKPRIILAATASNADISTKNLSITSIYPDENYIPIDYRYGVEKGSALDFSFLLDAPAGKYGFAKPHADTIVFENRPNVPVKFFGNNISAEANFPEKKHAVEIADTYARHGYNICRFHFHDDLLVDENSPNGIALNAQNIDKLDYLAAELKKRGIYFATDIYMKRVVKPEILEPEFKKIWLRNFQARKSIFFLSKNARDNLKQYASNLLNHVNPYTNLAWKDDPALVSINIINEDTMESIASNASTAHIFRGRYANWIKRNGAQETKENSAFLFSKFLSEMHKNFFDDMYSYLRSIGVKAMLTDENHMASVPQSLRAKNFDIIETHTYYGHPSFPSGKWGVDPIVKNTSSILEYGTSTATMPCVSHHNKPTSITEWNHVINNDTAAEGALIMGAYGAAQGLDILCRYTYCHKNYGLGNLPLSYFDTLDHPVVTLSERAASAFFLRGDVKESQLQIPLVISKNFFNAYSAEKTPLLQKLGQLYERLSLVGKPKIYLCEENSTLQFTNTKFFLHTDSNSQTANISIPSFYSDDLSDDTLCNISKLLGKDLINHKSGNYQNANKQISLNALDGTLKIATQKSEGFVLPAGKSLFGNFAKVKSNSSWSSIFLTSLDGQNLVDSQRMLILHLSDIKNTGMRFADTRKTVIYDMGHLPLLLRKATAEILLDINPNEWICYALSLNGKRMGEIKITQSGKHGKIVLNTCGKFAPTLAYELVKKQHN